MTVIIEPLAIGSLDGPRVYILVRQVGRHKDVEECPAEVEDDHQAIEFAARRWKVSERSVQLAPVQVVKVGED